MSKEDKMASLNPLLVMLDGKNGNRHMRAVGQKGMGTEKERWIG